MGSLLLKRSTYNFPRIAYLGSVLFFATSASGTSAGAETCSLAMSLVPDNMKLSSSMKKADISNAKLIPLTINGDTVVEDTSKTTSASDVLSSVTGKYGSLCFVVRRPG